MPQIFDRFHGHFSHRTEHHLFPSMNSDFYPDVSAALAWAPDSEVRDNPRSMALAPKSRLGNYLGVSHLGAGGMGEVYRARDTRLAGFHMPLLPCRACS